MARPDRLVTKVRSAGTEVDDALMNTTRGHWTRMRIVGVCLLCLVAAGFTLVGLGGCEDQMRQARQLEGSGDWEGALALYEQALAGDPDDLEAIQGVAVALWALQRYDEALDYQERAALGDPGDVQTRIELGFNYLGHQGRPNDAARVLGEAVELDGSAKNLTFLAQALEASGDLGGAERTLREAIEVDSHYAYAYGQLIELLEDQGRAEEAAELKAEAEANGVATGGSG
jgi:tetratricopeptide (TPR) repeat protein